MLHGMYLVPHFLLNINYKGQKVYFSVYHLYKGDTDI